MIRVVLATDLALLVKALVVVQRFFGGRAETVVRTVIVVRQHFVEVIDAYLGRVGGFARAVVAEQVLHRGVHERRLRAIDRPSVFFRVTFAPLVVPGGARERLLLGEQSGSAIDTSRQKAATTGVRRSHSLTRIEIEE